MRLVTLECPKCGAQLKVNGALTYGTCNYCGYQFLIDDEVKHITIDNPRQVGYEFERGKYEQRLDESRNLAKKVGDLIQPLSDLDSFKNESNVLNIQLQELKKKERMFGTAMFSALPCIIAAVIVFNAVLLATQENFLITLMIGSWFAGLGFLVTKMLSDRGKTQTGNELKKKAERYDFINGQIQFIENTYDFELIPQNYRHEETMRYICQALSNQRAMNIQEAINLYEDEQYKLKMEALHKEQIAVQKQQLEMSEREAEQREAERESRRAAIVTAGVLWTVGTLVKHLKDDVL